LRHFSGLKLLILVRPFNVEALARNQIAASRCFEIKFDWLSDLQRWARRSSYSWLIEDPLVQRKGFECS
jgi:hypothetical protein